MGGEGIVCRGLCLSLLHALLIPFCQRAASNEMLVAGELSVQWEQLEMIGAGTPAVHVSEPVPVMLPLTDTRKQGVKVNVCWKLESTQTVENFVGKSFLLVCHANGNT